MRNLYHRAACRLSSSIIVHYHPHHSWSSSFEVIYFWFSWQVYFYFTSEVQWELDSSHFRIKNPGRDAWKSNFISQEHWELALRNSNKHHHDGWKYTILSVWGKSKVKLFKIVSPVLYATSLLFSKFKWVLVHHAICFFCISCETLSKVQWHTSIWSLAEISLTQAAEGWSLEHVPPKVFSEGRPPSSDI